MTPRTTESAPRFKPGFPNPETTRTARDDADLQRAIAAYRFWYPTVSAEGIMQGQRDAGAHGHRARREDGRAGEHRKDAQEGPEHRRHQRHDVGFAEGEHGAARAFRSRGSESPGWCCG